MSWLRVPGAADDTPSTDTSNETSPSWNAKQSSEFDSNASYEEIDEEQSSYEVDDGDGYEAFYRKKSGAEAGGSDEGKLGSGDLVTPRLSGRENAFKKKATYENGTEEKQAEKVYDNISQYFMAYHSMIMEAWYETTSNMLINKQEYAVEAVKLEWLLKRKPLSRIRKAKKLQRKNAEVEESSSALKALTADEAQTSNGQEGENDDDNINTLSDVSDEIMDGKRKRANKKKMPKHNPTRDARRLYNLMKY